MDVGTDALGAALAATPCSMYPSALEPPVMVPALQADVFGPLHRIASRPGLTAGGNQSGPEQISSAHAIAAMPSVDSHLYPTATIGAGGGVSDLHFLNSSLSNLLEEASLQLTEEEQEHLTRLQHRLEATPGSANSNMPAFSQAHGADRNALSQVNLSSFRHHGLEDPQILPVLNLSSTLSSFNYVPPPTGAFHYATAAAAAAATGTGPVAAGPSAGIILSPILRASSPCMLRSVGSHSSSGGGVCPSLGGATVTTGATGGGHSASLDTPGGGGRLMSKASLDAATLMAALGGSMGCGPGV